MAEIVGNLAELLTAGADMRTALAILGGRANRPATAVLCRNLAGDIGGGEALDVAFTRHVGKRGALVGALVAAGEAGGDLAGGFDARGRSHPGQVEAAGKADLDPGLSDLCALQHCGGDLYPVVVRYTDPGPADRRHPAPSRRWPWR
ncbi:type II secretion system F family protein [Caulobacter segnis]